MSSSKRSTNEAGVSLIREFEGCRLESYKDIVGVETIAYGHTGADVTPGLKITQERADELLKQDLNKFEDGVSALVKVPLTDNQFAALVSFSYNLGLGALKTSFLLKCLSVKNYEGAATQFEKWCHAGGVIVPGLLRRRHAERDLFLKA